MPRPLSNRAAVVTRIARAGVVSLGVCLLLGACGSHPSGSSASVTADKKGSTTTTTMGLSQPTAAKPITILDVGDSLGEDLGLGLGYTLGTNALAHVVQAAYGDSGLARPDFYNWPAHLKADLNKYHPQVVTILIGGNDAQNFEVGSGPVVFGTAQWRTVYTARVDLMMSETLKAGAKMVWVGLPIMENPVFGAAMQTLNAIYKAQAALHPGVEYLPTWALFSNSEGQYTADLTNSSGQTVVARDPDGVHIAPPGGCDIVAGAAIKDIEKIWHIHLGL
ncbi:MAG: DUF459 domain-containing protein [Acidimicrobiales bacterium]